MARGKATPFAVDRDGATLFVKLKASGIHPLVALIDGLPVTLFGKGKTAYLTVRRAIEWHERELRESGGRSGSRKALDGLRRAQAKFEGGEVAAS